MTKQCFLRSSATMSFNGGNGPNGKLRTTTAQLGRHEGGNWARRPDKKPEKTFGGSPSQSRPRARGDEVTIMERFIPSLYFIHTWARVPE